LPDVLIIKNSINEGPANLGHMLESDGFKMQTILATKDKIPNDDYFLVVILGAPQSANGELDYLKNEIETIRKCVKSEIPVLGICLGSQLVAKALGGDVFPGSKKEIGFYHDLQIIGSSNLFSGMKNPLTVFHWHGDTFTLPKDTVRLVRSTYYENQAFQFGSAVGLQFHLEVDKRTILSWLNHGQKELERSNIDSNIILEALDENLNDVNNSMSIFYKNFKSEFNL